MSFPHLLTLGMLFFLPDMARANSVTIGASQDNTLFGNAGTLSNGAGNGVFSGLTGNGGVRRGLVQFDVASALPAGSTINSVQLSMYVTRTRVGGVTVELHRMLESWGEGTSIASFGGGGGAPAQTNDATWTHRFYPTTTWTTVGGTFSATASAAQSLANVGPYTWASTPALVADVQSFLDAPSGNFGWMLRSQVEALSISAKKLGSKEESTSFQPRLVIDYTPPSPFSAFCFGDGSGTPCPCGNAGATGNGCATSSHPGGANLVAAGVPSLAADTLVIQGSSMSAVGGVLYFQGSAPLAAGAGITFGDGLLCAGGSILRLGVKINSGGASQYPDPGDLGISLKGLVTTPGSVLHYQGWFRDSTVFCTPATHNLTNAVSVVWGA